MQTVDGFQTVTVSSEDGRIEAEFVPDANMLCCSLTHDGVQLLHAGAGVRAYAEQGKTMGIPLLHPWANRLAGFRYEVAGRVVTLPREDPRILLDPVGLPIHGVLPKLLRWEVGRAEAPGRLTADLTWDRPELLEVFPFAHQLSIEASAASGELAIATTLRPTGAEAVPASFGYHPYLVVPGSPRQDWEVTLGASRRLVLDQRMIPTGERAPADRGSFELGEAGLDDGFADLHAPALFEAQAAGASVALEMGSGYAFAQIYALPEHDFICFEPMTAPTNALVSGDGLRLVAPGGEHRAEFAVRVRH